MNVTVLLLLLCGIILPSQAKFSYEKFKDECADELNVDDAKIAKAFSQEYLPEHDRIFKAVFECIWVQEGLLDEEGRLNSDKFRQFLVQQFKKTENCHFLVAVLVTADVMNHCQHVKGLGGQLAVRMHNCVVGRIKYLDTYGDQV